MKFKYIFALCLSWVLLACTQQKNYKLVKYPEDYLAQIDMIYKKVDIWEGRIDLYTNPTSEKPTPIVLNIHGGGWNHGKKESKANFGSFFKNGYAVANVEYRLVDIAPAPAAIEDVRCALIYLFNNAKTLNIDTNKIVIMGASAGGHLALMTGLLGNNKRFDADCTYIGEIKIAAIINKYGITDLVPLTKSKSAKNWLANEFGNKKFTKLVSPLNYVSKDSPPIFIAHGDKDQVVPYSQSVKLYETLKKNGVKTEFLTIPEGKHGNFSKAQSKLFNDGFWEFLKQVI